MSVNLFQSSIEGLPLHQLAYARTIDEYDVTKPVPCFRVTSQINYDDVIMLSKNRPSLATMAKWMIDGYFKRNGMFGTKTSM